METVRDSRLKGRVTVQIDRCPRCGDEHRDLLMVELDDYIIVAGNYLNYWKLCPRMKTPILGWFSDNLKKMVEVV